MPIIPMFYRIIIQISLPENHRHHLTHLHAKYAEVTLQWTWRMELF